MNDFNVIRVAVDDDVARRVRPVVARYEQQIAAQQRMIERLRFLSPAVLMQDALNDIAGTGTPRHRHFLDQVDQFHARWRGFFVPLIFQKAQIASFDNVPRFSYREEATSDVARRVLVGLLGLTAPAVCAGGLGRRRLRRYPIVN